MPSSSEYHDCAGPASDTRHESLDSAEAQEELQRKLADLELELETRAQPHSSLSPPLSPFSPVPIVRHQRSVSPLAPHPTEDDPFANYLTLLTNYFESPIRTRSATPQTFWSQPSAQLSRAPTQSSHAHLAPRGTPAPMYSSLEYLNTGSAGGSAEGRAKSPYSAHSSEPRIRSTPTPGPQTAQNDEVWSVVDLPGQYFGEPKAWTDFKEPSKGSQGDRRRWLVGLGLLALLLLLLGGVLGGVLGSRKHSSSFVASGNNSSNPADASINCDNSSSTCTNSFSTYGTSSSTTNSSSTLSGADSLSFTATQSPTTETSTPASTSASFVSSSVPGSSISPFSTRVYSQTPTSTSAAYVAPSSSSTPSPSPPSSSATPSSASPLPSSSTLAPHTSSSLPLSSSINSSTLPSPSSSAASSRQPLIFQSNSSVATSASSNSSMKAVTLGHKRGLDRRAHHWQ